MPQFPMSPDKESYEPQSADTTQITANMPEINISFVPASHLLSAKNFCSPDFDSASFCHNYHTDHQ